MLTLKTIFGAAWTISGRLSGRIIDFVTLLLLARVLTPADFGIVALAATLIAVVETVLEIPLSQALTRLRELDRVHLDTAFTLGLLRSCIFAAIVLAAAWPFSAFYHDGRLIAVIAALCVAPVARGFYSPAMVASTRELRFRPVFLALFFGKVLAAMLAAVVLFVGGGYWAIVANTVTAAIGATLFSYVFAPYLPRLSLQRFQDFWGFMSWFSFTQFVTAFNWQFDRILLGNFVTRSELGKFSMASDIAVLPTQSLVGPAMQPLMSAFATINDDAQRLRSAFLKASRYTMMLAIPSCAFIAVAADLLADILLGPQWRGAGFYLTWLAVAAIPNAYLQPLSSLAMAISKPKAPFFVNLIDLAFKVVLTPLGLMLAGIIGVILARAISSILLFVVCVLTAKSLVNANTRSQLINLWEIIAATAATVAIVMVLRTFLQPLHLHPFIQLGAIGAVGALCYSALLASAGVRPPVMLGARS